MQDGRICDGILRELRKNWGRTRSRVSKGEKDEEFSGVSIQAISAYFPQISMLEIFQKETGVNQQTTMNLLKIKQKLLLIHSFMSLLQ